MISENKLIEIHSFNARGLRNKCKRKNIFQWLKTSHPGITMLQETHSILTDHNAWAGEWEGKIFYSDGEANSKGVATLIPKNLSESCEIIETKSDNNGRLLLINCKILETELILINVYVPTKDNPSGQDKFFKYLYELIETYSDKNIIIGGDLNTYLDINVDKKGGRIEKQSTFSENMNNICTEFSLIDIWRIRNPKISKFTRIERSRNGIVQSRLDYLLTSISLTYQIKNTKISPGNSSDHSLISLSLNIGEQTKRGKGYWKFNNDLLIEKDYATLINERLADIKLNVKMADKTQLWEYVKCQLRTDTILYSCKRAKENREIESNLKDKLEILEQKLGKNENISDLDFCEYVRTKSDWESHIAKKNNGILLRSKAKWIEEGEKNTKYFLNLEKRNYNNTCIKTLINKDNTEITDMTKILDEEKTFYENLYTSKLSDTIDMTDKTKSFNTENPTPILTEPDKNSCDTPITIEECSNALKLLPNNKSPGSDGFTTNFYKFFWKDIKVIVFESFEHSFKTKKLSDFQRMGILNLLPKKDKDLRYLANWRPVSLLNTDYKVLTKLLAIRLQKVIPSLVNPDQVGYIKNRYIGENIRILSDILQYAELENIEAYITQIDFEKAFDSVEWRFLFDTLKTLNFGEYFTSWIKTLYTDISACAGNNGNYSEYFKLSRSIRQGCPISALLFLLVVEMLANKIRNDPNIKGVEINNEIFKLAMMADDITLINVDLQSIVNAIKIFCEFEKCSGLKLNLGKTEIIPIGNQRGKKIRLPSHLEKITVKNRPFKALGVWFSIDTQETLNLNLTERIKAIATLINIWKGRRLSLKGKITILKTLILPQVQFLFSMIEIPETILNQIDKIFFDYLWDSKPSKIKRSTIIAPIEQGGLAMIDVHEIHTAAKCSWIRRLHDTTKSKWKNSFLKLMNIEMHMFNKNLDIKMVDKCKTEFHKQILSSWIKIYCIEPKTYTDIINQFLVFNKTLKINKQAIIPSFFKGNDTNKIHNIRILNMLSAQNAFHSLYDFNLINCTKLTILQYNALKSCIPKTWKKVILGNYNKSEAQILVPTLHIRNAKKSIAKITSKELYQNLIFKKIKTPTAIESWTNIYPFLERYDWKDIYTIPFKYVQEPYLQSFQYKIINRILNTNEKLHKWSIKQTNQCNFCQATDTIEHHLYSCKDSNTIWNQLENWLLDCIEIKLNLKECEILFGIPNAPNEHLELINFVIIMTKWYINNRRSENKPLYFIELINMIKGKIKSMTLANSMNSRTNKPWQDMLDELI